MGVLKLSSHLGTYSDAQSRRSGGFGCQTRHEFAREARLDESCWEAQPPCHGGNTLREDGFGLVDKVVASSREYRLLAVEVYGCRGGSVAGGIKTNQRQLSSAKVGAKIQATMKIGWLRKNLIEKLCGVEGLARKQAGAAQGGQASGAGEKHEGGEAKDTALS